MNVHFHILRHVGIFADDWEGKDVSVFISPLAGVSVSVTVAADSCVTTELVLEELECHGRGCTLADGLVDHCAGLCTVALPDTADVDDDCELVRFRCFFNDSRSNLFSFLLSSFNRLGFSFFSFSRLGFCWLGFCWLGFSRDCFFLNFSGNFVDRAQIDDLIFCVTGVLKADWCADRCAIVVDPVSCVYIFVTVDFEILGRDLIIEFFLRDVPATSD